MFKRNVINVTNSHHGSTGKYYCYGIRENYRIIEQSSVTKYSHKKISKETINSLSIDRSNILYKMSSSETNNGIKALNTLI